MRPDERLDPEHEKFLRRVAAQIRKPVPLSDSVEQRVLERLRGVDIHNADQNRIHRGRRVFSAAIAAGIAAVFGIGVLVGRRSVVPGPADSSTKPIEFVLETAADSAVMLVGDFNDWDPRATPLRHQSDSLWSVTVPLRPGRYRYTFVVDGTRWRRDPSAPAALEDDFGAPTSVITIAQR